jgi:hypothetical protein
MQQESRSSCHDSAWPENDGERDYVQDSDIYSNLFQDGTSTHTNAGHDISADGGDDAELPSRHADSATQRNSSRLETFVDNRYKKS